MESQTQSRVSAVVLDNGDLLMANSGEIMTCGARATDNVVRALASIGALTQDEEVAYHRAALARV